MSGTDAIELAKKIYEQRVGRQVGSIATIAGIAGAGFLGLLRYHGLASYAFSVVATAFAGAMLVGPIAERIGRRLAARKFLSAVEAEDQALVSAPIELRKQLRAQSLATANEGEGWSLAKNAVLAIVSWLWLFGIVDLIVGDAAIGSALGSVGKALSYLMTHGGVALGLFALAAHLQGRSITRSKKPTKAAFTTMAILAAMVLPAFTADAPFPISLAVSTFYFGIAGVFVMFPSLWWSRKRLLRERRVLDQLVLPTHTEDSDAVRRMLLSALEWSDGPPPLRAAALRELAARLGSTEITPHLDRALASGVTELRTTALELSRSLRHRPPLELLLAIENEREAALLPALLHRHRGPEVEGALLRLLTRDDATIQSAAAESLGLVGSIDAVAALKIARSRNGFTNGGRVAMVCQEAIERIRIRLSCSPGQLAVVEEPQTGALSDPASEPATLSFARDE